MKQSPGNLHAGLSSTALETAAALHGGVSASETLKHTIPEQVVASLEEAISTFRSASAGAGREAVRERILDLLEAGRYPAFLRGVAGSPLAARWLAAVLEAITAADVGLGDIFRLRTSQRPERALFRVPAKDGGLLELSRAEVGERVRRLAAGLARAAGGPVTGGVAVAILAPNRIETILVDLACLTHGIVNVPIAADATPDHVRFILERTGSRVLVAADQARIDSILSAGPLPSVRRVILMDPPDDPMRSSGFRLLSEIEEEGRSGGPVEMPRVPSRDLATILFTSGTTGNPKGIRFSQRNIVYKRFCRAVALPEIGEDDEFLCYLPLFHTFGRWLEMTGCLFWGSCYNAAENPSIEAVLAGMRRFRPSVFISIPKRWIQIHEKAAHAAGGGTTDSGEIEPAHMRTALEEITGGRLRWGLSAAGHLDADVFLFFQRNGIELLSGFGMTEATGGITMTPPGSYRRGTVGVALPGVEVQRAEDGELLVRGPYMMLGYDDPDEIPRDYETDWFATGDLVKQDSEGYVTIVDRKKDIYKNVKGQTIAPARIENLFDEFEEIKRSFLVGDGREYNTILLYPDYDAAGGKLARMSGDELRDYLSSFVVSVNRFLAPYERVVDFDLLPRYFREDKGELTPKGTFIRKVVERSFSDLIDTLYARVYVMVRVDGIDVRVPTWLLREKGLTADVLAAEPGGVRLRETGERLAIARVPGAAGKFRVGNYIYSFAPEAGRRQTQVAIDLDPLLRLPRCWVGNAELVRFAGEGLLRRPRRGNVAEAAVVIEGCARPARAYLDIARQRFAASRNQGERGAVAVHRAAALLFCAQGEEALSTLESAADFLDLPISEEAALMGDILSLLRFHADPAVRRRALALLVARKVNGQTAATLRNFLEADPEVLTPEVRAALLKNEMPAATIRSLLDLVIEASSGGDGRPAAAKGNSVASLLRLAGEIAASQPRWYRPVRQLFLMGIVQGEGTDAAAAAAAERTRSDQVFRTWIASGWTEPADPRTGDSLPWEEVVGFDERIEPPLREALLDAFRRTTVLRESVYLLSDEVLLSGEDMLPGGIWVSRLGSGHGKTVLRAAVRTRQGRRHEFVIKITSGMSSSEMAAEAEWMIRLGAPAPDVRLVADFGGFWPEQAFWTEEYVSGETVLAYLERMTVKDDAERAQRAATLWPHLAWNALASFASFWRRAGGQIVLSDPAPANIIVAAHDYQEGSRIVSVTSHKRYAGMGEMLRFLYEGFVEATESAFPVLRGSVPRRIAFAGVIEALSEKSALPLLERAKAEMRERSNRGDDPSWKAWHDELDDYLSEVRRDGYAPRRLVMAVRRYHTWAGLNADASVQARAIMLQELYDTYDLTSLETRHPELRVRFFRMTVFANARGPLAAELDALIRGHRDAPLHVESLLRRMTILHQSFPLDESETYFLARMTYSHLNPAQRVHLELLEEGGEAKAELVEDVRDSSGEALTIRAPASPKETIRLHHLFEQSGLAVVFRPEHRFLLILDDQENVAGGIFYRSLERGTVHMEKIVVGPRHRGRGVGEMLMKNFMQRMRDLGEVRVTTGFFQPHYFYQFGFRLERGFSGLVKDLERTPED